MTKKDKIRTGIGIFFIALSITCVALYFFQDKLTAEAIRRVQLPAVVEEVKREDILENEVRPIPNHNEEVIPLSLTHAARELVTTSGEKADNIFRDYMIGQIVIPSRSTNLAILRGATNETLLRGAGAMNLDQKMGEGNYALAGHYQFEEGVLFNAVYDMAIGTEVFITDKENVYRYVIYSHSVEPDTAFYMIDDKVAEDRGNPVLTLMTCPISSNHGTRIFAVGDLVETFPYEEGMFSSASTFVYGQ